MVTNNPITFADEGGYSRLDWLDLAQVRTAQNTTKTQYNSVENITNQYNLFTGGMDTSIQQSRKKFQGAKTDAKTKHSSALPRNDIKARVIDNIENDTLVAGYSTLPRNMCLACAERVTEILNIRNVAYQVMGVLTWSGINDSSPANHYAVIACIDGQKLVIDPTAGQFGNFQVFYSSIDEWSIQFKNNMPRRLIKTREFSTLRDAKKEIGTIWASPLDFDGSVLQNTKWHERIENNKDAFRALQQRDIRANFGAPSPARRFMGGILSCIGRR